MDGIGDLEYVILGSIVELGVSMNVLLDPKNDRGNLDLRPEVNP